MPKSSLDSEIETRHLSTTHEKIGDLRQRIEVIQEELELLAAEAFQNGRIAVQAIDVIIAEKSVREVCTMLDNRGLLHYGIPFGMLRGHITDTAGISRANTAIAQLKEKIRERAALTDQLAKMPAGDGRQS